MEQNGMTQEETVQLPLDQMVTVELPAEQWSHIMQGIDELPRKIAQPLHDHIRNVLIQVGRELQSKPDSHDKEDEHEKEESSLESKS